MAKILVIDDEEGIRDLLDTLLSRKGYDVVLAESGQKGLEPQSIHHSRPISSVDTSPIGLIRQKKALPQKVDP
jgi:CheY-like chemotaxis protein